jgi:hypothetical protein
MKYFTLLVSLGLLLISCTKDKIVYKEKETSWKAHPAFYLSDKIVYNSYATDSDIYFYGADFFTSIDSNFNSSSSSVTFYTSYVKRPIGKDFFVELKPGYPYLFIKPNARPTDNLAAQGFEFKRIDSTFQGLAMEYFSKTNEVAAISDQNQLLIPIFTNEDNYPYLAFYQIGVITQPYIANYLRVDTAYVRKIHIKTPYSPGSGKVLKIQSYYGKFFVSDVRSSFVIHSDGTHKKIVDEPITQYFKYQNSLYGSSYWNNHIYKSEDEGETWKLAYNGALPLTSNTFNIGNDVFFYLGDKMAQLQIYPDSIRAKELVNDGLVGNQITSVSKLKDRIYVTTLSGVYYKPYNSLLTYIEPK